MRKRVIIVENDPLACSECNSRLQGDLCCNCNLRFMSFDGYLDNSDELIVQNPEEYIRIAKRKLRRLEKEKRDYKLHLQKRGHKQSLSVIDRYIEELDQQIEEIKNKSFLQNTSQENDVVYIYYKLNNRCMRENHPIEAATAKTIDLVTGNDTEINVYFCKKCNRYFVNYEALKNEFYNIGIYPLLHFEKEFLVNTLDKISELRIYGYNVQEGKLTTFERQTILARIMDNNLIPKEKIIRNLQFLISYNGKKEGNTSAKSKWEEDLVFVSRYTTNNKRAIKAKFKR